jgi:hypothetical protein
MGEGAPQDITGEYPDYGMLAVSPEGKPSFQVSREQVTTPATKGGRKIKTNLFKRKAGWKWTQAPEGFDPDPAGDFPLISVHDGKQHYYTLSTEFPEGVELARYEKSATEPRLRPTRQGSVELGNVVGEISVRGKKHPVYDRATVKGIAGSGMAVGTAGLTLTSEDADASLLGVGSTIGKKAEDMLGMAMTMRERGLNPTEIWNKTGWEFNEYDGRWRTEHNNYENTKIRMPERSGKYSIYDIVDDPDLLGAYNDEDSSDRVMDMYGLDQASKVKLGNLSVEITPELKSGDASLDNRVIRIGEGTSPEDFRSSVLHEMQHAIQDNESFAVGGNDELFADRRYRYSPEQAEQRRQEVRQKLDVARGFMNNPPPDATLEQMSKMGRAIERGEKVLRAIDAYERDSLQGQRSPYQMYEAMMGEVEARNVEERDQPLSFIRQFTPEASEDPRFDRANQIVMDESGAPYYDEYGNRIPYRATQGLDINYPRQVSVGEARTPEADYNIVDRALPAVAAAYDYGGGANIPMRPEPTPTAPELMNQASREFESGIMPVGLGGDPYSFLMAGGMDQREATGTLTDVYTNIARGTGTAILGSLGELETLLVGGLLPAIVGVGYGSPIDRALYGMSIYDPMFPNTEDANRMLPEFFPNLTDLDPEAEKISKTFGEMISPL